jgi:hypothetical protein
MIENQLLFELMYKSKPPNFECRFQQLLNYGRKITTVRSVFAHLPFVQRRVFKAIWKEIFLHFSKAALDIKPLLSAIERHTLFSKNR